MGGMSGRGYRRHVGGRGYRGHVREAIVSTWDGVQLSAAMGFFFPSKAKCAWVACQPVSTCVPGMNRSVVLQTNSLC